MISVPSHRQRSNGSSLGLLAVLLFLVTSCALFQPTKQSTQETDIVKEDVGDSTPKVDTITLTQVPAEEFPPITERTLGPETSIKQTYRVVLSAPFGASKFDSSTDRLSARSSRMLQFYLGFKYALEQLHGPVGINLSVFDTDGQTLTPDRLQQMTSFREADLFIGPYFSGTLQSMAQFAKAEQKVIVSPWNSTNAVSDNPFYLQLRPSLERHCERLTEFAKSRNPQEEILIITTDSERDAEIRKTIQATHTRIENDPSAVPLNEFIISDINAEGITDQFLSIWQTDSVRSIILPLWSSQSFLVSVLSKINFAKGNRTISVYGLPQWTEMDRMDFDILENLEVFVSTNRPVRFEGRQETNFARYFFDHYGTLPDPEAYYGMDIAQWIGVMLERAGSLITEELQNPNDPSLGQKFDFVTQFGEDGETIDYHVNDFLQMLKFENYQFVPIDAEDR